ncbi:MAG: DUF86 domain-containing protein [Bacteroidales bacterium]|nr:DUF86 domain-containing protein [Bacteroidales bacterium]
MDNQIELLKQMLSATVKCLAIADKISCVDDIKKTLIYDNLISNLLLIKEIEGKLHNDIKEKNNIINWEKFTDYESQIISDYHSLDHDTIYSIIKEELPSLQNKLQKIIFQ